MLNRNNRIIQKTALNYHKNGLKRLKPPGNGLKTLENNIKWPELVGLGRGQPVGKQDCLSQRQGGETRGIREQWPVVRNPPGLSRG